MDFSAFGKYFLGANSCEGFVSRFKESYSAHKGERAFIIKGGPGTGKSSLMKFIASKCAQNGKEIELFPCSSDPDSLDGIKILPEGTVFLDGTAPHIIEPEHPGVCEQIVDPGRFWNADLLRVHRKQIIETMALCKAYHAQAARYIFAAGRLLGDNIALQKTHMNTDKIHAFARSLSKKHLPEKRGKGSITERFLSGITPKGIVFYSSTLKKNIKQRIIISDKYGAVASQIMEYLLNDAVKKGYSVIAVRSAFFPSCVTDHIIIRELSLAFCSENDYMHIGTDERRVHSRRFEDKSFKTNREKLRFNAKAAKEMLISACEALNHAKAVHDDLEAYYIKAMDFSALSNYASELLNKII